MFDTAAFDLSTISRHETYRQLFGNWPHAHNYRYKLPVLSEVMFLICFDLRSIGTDCSSGSKPERCTREQECVLQVRLSTGKWKLPLNTCPEIFFKTMQSSTFNKKKLQLVSLQD
jgi:hypothetical protein